MKELVINTDDLIKEKIEKSFDIDDDILIIQGMDDYHFSMLVGSNNGYFWLDLAHQHIDDEFEETFTNKYEALKHVIMLEYKVYRFEDQRSFVNWFSTQTLGYGDRQVSNK